MLETVNKVFQTFGASVLVPIMIFVVALFLRVKPKTAMMSAFYAGVGLTGFGWIITMFTPVVTKIIKQMVNNTGIKLPVVDIGWQAGSLASFGSSVGLSFFVFGLIAELILFALGITKIFMASNLWNNFGFMIWGTLCFYVTHNFWLSLGLSFFMLLYALALAEIQADRWSDYYGVKNASVSSLHNIEQTVPAIILDPLWNLLGFNKVKMTPDYFKRKLGVFGEPTTLGALLGIIIGVLGNIRALGTLHAWGQILSFAIQLAAVMTIFPLVTGVFAKAFTPLAEEIDKHRENDGDAESTFEDLIQDKKRWFLGVDDGVGYGEPATIISGVILIPIMVIIAFILPGNKSLPIVDLISLPFMVESIVAITKGNILKVIANGIVWFSLGLYAASWLGSVYTGAVSHYGVAIPAGIVLITSFNLMARPLNALIFAAFISQNPLWIGLAVLVYLILLYALRRYRPTIWQYLKRMSDKNAGYSGSNQKINY
ncbi:PTS galactitol transporter subunit IIC [Furfurilactobacillus rossiae]|uniref:PTS system galactitol-specific IIC component n=1 Tax=Furfurilactobacillus rossiae DSM 15814 TaxID=1114972 RepID=A0A0R1RGT5_9LACO|nr:PTS transporter subunit IIC [Furfurilactobacillus rossiae]KRL56087.1 PTS system galactitol-specific IIC component [Furfurilactobacillus rossiae DSM 15814]QFR66113.1 PTS galactitol transporter subunit IIC [Furfurilactobacillus rossiae]QLE61541.1 PTS system galactitol-specific IIC component [Furfurilactobacillus rossiae]